MPGPGEAGQVQICWLFQGLEGGRTVQRFWFSRGFQRAPGGEVVLGIPTTCFIFGCAGRGWFRRNQGGSGTRWKVPGITDKMCVHENFLGKNTGVGCHFLHQGIFPALGSNRGVLHCKRILYLLSHRGNPTDKRPLLQIRSLPLNKLCDLGQVDTFCSWEVYLPRS